MKIGTANSSEMVTGRDFERLAEEAGLGKALVRARVPQMVERVSAALERVDIAHPDAEKVAVLR